MFKINIEILLDVCTDICTVIYIMCTVYRNNVIYHVYWHVILVGGPPHDQQPGQNVDEDPSDPGRHGVSLRGAEVDIEHHHRHTNTEI